MGALEKALFRLRHSGAIMPWVLIYYAMSIAFVTTSKSVLLQLPHLPWTLSFLQCAVAAGCSRAWLASSRGGVTQNISPQQWRFLIGGSVTCWLGFACANLACSAMNASLVETTKATTPIPQVLLAACLGDGWPTAHTRRALTVIVAGVMMASYADSTVCFWGLVACAFMNINFALSDNIVKLSYKLPGRLDASNLWFRSAQLGTLFAAPTALAEVMLLGAAEKRELGLALHGSSVLVALLSGFAFWLYNQAICELLGLVPIAVFAVLGSVRRAVTIVAVTLYFGTEVTLLNSTGLCVAALGFMHFMSKREVKDTPQSPPAAKVVPCLPHSATMSTASPASSSSAHGLASETPSSEEDIEFVSAFGAVEPPAVGRQQT